MKFIAASYYVVCCGAVELSGRGDRLLDHAAGRLIGLSRLVSGDQIPGVCKWLICHH